MPPQLAPTPPLEPSSTATPRRHVIQELTKAWSVFRLYPDQPDREEFVSAVAGVTRALRRLADHCRFELRRGCFFDPDGHEDLTDAGAGLAAALYQHGVELLDLDPEVSPRMLAEAFAGIEAGGDALGDLVDQDTATLRLGRLHPEAQRRTAAPADTVWDALADGRTQAHELIAQFGPEPSGDDVFTWFRGLGAALDHRGDAPEFVGRVRRVVAYLPQSSRDQLLETMLEHEDEHPVAARYVAGVPDAELAQCLARLPDVETRAQRYVAAGLRRQGFAELVGWWRTTDDGDGGVNELSDCGPLCEPDEDETVAATVARFLRLTDDAAAAGAALSRWKLRVHDALSKREQQRLVRLLNPVSAVRDDVPAETRRLIDTALETALDHTDVVRLLPDDPEAEPVEARALLAPLGGPAITLLMTALASERRRVHRAQLVALINSLVPGHLERLGPWLRDDRWFVARNVMTILERLGDPEAHGLIETALGHDEPRVRLEAARALRATGTDEAVRLLRQLVSDRDERVRLGAIEALAASTRRGAIDELLAIAADADAPRDARERSVEMLGEHPAPRAAEGLTELIERGALPRRMRGRAELLLHRGEGRR